MKPNFIGQGTYGCIYKPNIPCKNEKPGKKTKQVYISKLQRITPSSEREETLGKLIVKKVKNYSKLFAPIVDSCPINIEKVDKDAIQKCEPIMKNIQQGINVQYKSYKMRYAGNQFLSQYFLSLLHNNPKKLIKRIIETHIYLLKSLDILGKQNPPIIHYDLKDNNIMYDEKLGVPIIIDFGLSFELDTSKAFDKAIALEQYYIFYEKYPPWNIELVLLSYITQHIATNRELTTKIEPADITKLTTICNTFVSRSDILQIISKEEIHAFEQGLIQVISLYKDKSWNTLFQDLQKGYSSWDNYAMSVIYLFYIKDLFHGIENVIIKNYKEVLTRIIVRLPNVQPIKIVEVIAELKKIATTVNKREYHKIIQSIRKEDPVIVNINLNKSIVLNEYPPLYLAKLQNKLVANMI